MTKKNNNLTLKNYVYLTYHCQCHSNIYVPESRQGSVVETEAGGWWKVTLATTSYVAYITVYNRVDCCKGRLDQATVYLDDVLVDTIEQENEVQHYTFQVKSFG